MTWRETRAKTDSRSQQGAFLECGAADGRRAVSELLELPALEPQAQGVLPAADTTPTQPSQPPPMSKRERKMLHVLSGPLSPRSEGARCFFANMLWAVALDRVSWVLEQWVTSARFSREAHGSSVTHHPRGKLRLTDPHSFPWRVAALRAPWEMPRNVSEIVGR